eukprot:4102956-Ditylum_brightwellii.AAC.1
MVYGFGQNIKQERDPDLPSIEDDTLDATIEDVTKAAKSLKLNAIAICNLTIAFISETLAGLIYATITMY